jgi:DNA-binding NarL/FixJ family response regulator
MTVGAGGRRDAGASSASRARIRVAIVGGLTLSRDGTRALVEREPELDVVAAGDDPLAVLRETKAPDIVLFDSDDPAERVGATLRELRRLHENARILVVTARTDRGATARLVLEGAHGIVFKSRSSEHLIEAIRKVNAGELWVDRVVATKLIADMTRLPRRNDPESAKITSLTPRERDIVALVASGLANKAIAARLSISDNTVRHHLTSIFAKLEIADRLSLVVYSYKHKLV